MVTTRPGLRRRPQSPDLASVREAKGISLQQISEVTKISVRYLEAIETSQYDRLPGGVFRTSYIRQYARAIEWDEWDLLASYDSTIPPEPMEPSPPRGLLGTVLRLPVLRLLAPDKRG